MEPLKAYKEVLEAIEKNKDVFDKDYGADNRNLLKSRIKAHEIASYFGISLNPYAYEAGSEFVRLSDYCLIAMFGKDMRRTISWSDDGRQPEGEWLYRIGFPTGAYIFGDHYPKETFNNFFVELKSYEPKYSDSNNHNLYFTQETAKKVHEDFKGLMEKYRLLSGEELKASRILELEKQLAKLKPQPDVLNQA